MGSKKNKKKSNGSAAHTKVAPAVENEDVSIKLEKIEGTTTETPTVHPTTGSVTENENLDDTAPVQESEKDAGNLETTADKESENKIKALQSQVKEMEELLQQKSTECQELKNNKDEEINLLSQKLKETELKVDAVNENQSQPNAVDATLVEDLRQQLQSKTDEASKNKENYDMLLSKVSQMKNIFNKMKQSESRLESAEAENVQLKAQLEQSLSKASNLEKLHSELNSEVINLNSECDKLTEKNKELKEKLESQEFQLEDNTRKLEDENRSLKKELKVAKSDLEEYLILIQEEKMAKANLHQEITDLKATVENLQSENASIEKKSEKIAAEVHNCNITIDQLKKDNEKIVDDVKVQLNSKQAQLNQFTDEIDTLNAKIIERDMKIETLTGLENTLKEKQLLIGKLRHETITLNEHLNKAMKLVKKESGKETVDRELVSNLFISFLQIPRGDTKKFEVLQLLANFLDWDDDKRRHAGLLSSANYNSSSNSVVEVPRPDRQNSHSNPQSFVSLWTEFLEKESTPQDAASDK